jgi:hypothetical protein
VAIISADGYSTTIHDVSLEDLRGARQGPGGTRLGGISIGFRRSPRSLAQSISNQTHTQLFRSTPQRSEMLSTIGSPHPPLKSARGRVTEGTLKPEPGSRTLPRTASPDTATESEILSFGKSPAWRILLATSSLTAGRTSSNFSGGKSSASGSRALRAVRATSGLGASLRSILAPSRVTVYRFITYELPAMVCCHTPVSGVRRLLHRRRKSMYEGHRLDYPRSSTAVGQRTLAEAKMPEQSKRKEQQNHKLRSVGTSAFRQSGF